MIVHHILGNEVDIFDSGNSLCLLCILLLLQGLLTRNRERYKRQLQRLFILSLIYTTLLNLERRNREKEKKITSLKTSSKIKAPLSEGASFYIPPPYNAMQFITIKPTVWNTFFPQQYATVRSRTAHNRNQNLQPYFVNNIVACCAYIFRKWWFSIAL